MKLFKNNPDDKISWVDNLGESVGVFLFKFDGNDRVFNMFRDYPHELTAEQKAIFDRENPYWAEFFSDRQGGANE